MADVSAEVMNALVRLMNNEIALDQLDTDALLALGTAARGGRKLLQRVIVTLKRAEGDDLRRDRGPLRRRRVHSVALGEADQGRPGSG